MSSLQKQQQMRASHILIKQEGSRRKASWKDPNDIRIRSTARESAVAQLRALREITTDKARFEDIAARHSDCSTTKCGGNLSRLHSREIVVMDSLSSRNSKIHVFLLRHCLWLELSNAKAGARFRY